MVSKRDVNKDNWFQVTHFPKVDIVHVGGLDLLVATLAILSAQEFLDLVEDLGSVGKQEGRPWRQLIEEEKFLFFSDFQVVTLLSLFQELEVLGHKLLVRESNTTDTLQRIVALITEEIGRGVLCR